MTKCRADNEIEEAVCSIKIEDWARIAPPQPSVIHVSIDATVIRTQNFDSDPKNTIFLTSSFFSVVHSFQTRPSTMKRNEVFQKMSQFVENIVHNTGDKFKGGEDFFLFVYDLFWKRGLQTIPSECPIICPFWASCNLGSQVARFMPIRAFTSSWLASPL